MPVNVYFKGAGDKVMDNMQSEYGASKGKKIFYATANAKGMTANDPGVRALATKFRGRRAAKKMM